MIFGWKSLKESVIARHGIWVENPKRVRHCEAGFVAEAIPVVQKQIASRRFGKL